MKNYYLFFLIIILLISNSCKKLDYQQSTKQFGEVYFEGKSSIPPGYFKINYNGFPLEGARLNQKIRVPDGEGKIEFFDGRSGEKVAEKVLQVELGKEQRYIMFQPTENAKISFLNPNGQSLEVAPPPGFLKIKIANYCAPILPNEVDVVVYNREGKIFYPIDTIINVKQNLDAAAFVLIKKERVSGASQGYRFSFLDSKTKMEIKNQNGKLYIMFGTITLNQPKGVYTIFLSPELQEYDLPTYMKFNDKLYQIKANILFQD